MDLWNINNAYKNIDVLFNTLKFAHKMLVNIFEIRFLLV